jgi:hypothetical protein
MTLEEFKKNGLAFFGADFHGELANPRGAAEPHPVILRQPRLPPECSLHQKLFEDQERSTAMPRQPHWNRAGTGYSLPTFSSAPSPGTSLQVM